MNTNESLQLNNNRGGGTPLISIVIPTYNAGKFIDLTLNSVMLQPENVELVIVDDGSKDNTVEIINRYKNNNIKLICLENGGVGRARNIGLKKATGDYVIFLDHDDLILPDSINGEFVTLIKKYKDNNIDIIYTSKSQVDMNFNSDIKVTYAEEIKDMVHGMPRLEFWTCIYRRKFLLEKNIAFCETRIDIETAFRIRCFWQTSKIIVAPEMQFYLNRVNYSSVSHTWDVLLVDSIKARAYNELFSEFQNLERQYRDIIWLKYIAFQCLYDGFRIIHNSGYSSSISMEQISTMIDVWKNNKFSFKEFMALENRAKLGYLKRKLQATKYGINKPGFINKICRQENIKSHIKDNALEIVSLDILLERWKVCNKNHN